MRSLNRVLSILVAVVAIFLFSAQAKAQCFSSCGQSQASFDINIPCAVQAASVAAGCRANGGRFLGCAIEGFGAYLSCNGGLRARRVQARRAQFAACR